MPQEGTARYWLGTIPIESWIFPSPLPGEIAYAKGQEERGTESGYHHVQILVVYKRPVRRSQVSKTFAGHWEKSRSSAASEYVWKDDTAVPNTQFEIGTIPMQRNEKKDWDVIRKQAEEGDFSAIPADIYIRCYNNLKRIAMDYSKCPAIERTCYVFWGRTGTGKSRRAWDEAGIQAFAKDPRTKWWCGYQSQENVIIDEFRGDISISHILRWLDRYPVRVETKGGATPLLARTIWITSNLDPRKWYSDLDQDSLAALLRRLNITHFAYFLWLNEGTQVR